MKHDLQRMVEAALAALQRDGTLPAEPLPPVQVERARDPRHGDWACSVALGLARLAGRRPREIAEAIVGRLGPDPRVSRVEVAGAGFINFFLAPDALLHVVGAVLAAGPAYGRSDLDLVIERHGDELRIRPAPRRLGDVLGKLARFSPDFMREGRALELEEERDAL